MPLFTVIIPVYNRRELLVPTLESVFAQQCDDYEVIVVDDGSTDGTVETLQPFGDRVRVLQQKNAGPGAARNRGIGQAKGRYVAFLDSDDLWFPWTLATYADVIAQHGEPAFIAGRGVEFTDVLQLPAKPEPLNVTVYADYLATARAGVWIGTCAVAIDAEALRSVGGFESRRMNAEDSDLWMRLGATPGFVRINQPPVFGYRRHEGSEITSLPRTLDGINVIMQRERDGHYPGGSTRRLDRIRILTRHARPVSFACLRAGRFADAWRIYARAFRWHLRLGRFRYLLAFPMMGLWRCLSRGGAAI